MILCTRCGHQNMEGTLVCDRCSNFLAVDMPTPLMVTRKHTTSGLLARAPYHLQVTNSEMRLFLKPALLYQMRNNFIDGRLVLGRADESADHSMLSVNMPNAIELGVSRYHAALTPSAEGVGLYDLGSTNGTYLNEARLVVRQVYRLEHGDKIQLGQLILHVVLE